MLQLDVQLSPNVRTTPIVDTMKSVPKYKTVTHDNVWMHAAELLVVQTHFALPTIITEHVFVMTDILEIQIMYKLDVRRR